jgi:hypothetical protein
MDDAGMTVNLSNFSAGVLGFYRTTKSYKIDVLPRSARPFRFQKYLHTTFKSNPTLTVTKMLKSQDCNVLHEVAT